jgi:glycosyltransferase involved in cell wall biosynthesis
MTVSVEQPASISVVVPTFNDVGRIGDALESIVNQTLAPAEIVVSDDASDDDLEAFVRDFAAGQAGGVDIRYVRLASRSGDAAARNAGIAAARGEWIAICDSDDVWAPAKLERQMDFVGDWRGTRRIALLGTHGYNMNDAKRVISPAIMGPTTEDEYNAVRERGGLFFVIHSSVLFSRADFDALGGYSTDEYGAANEFDLFCRMAERGVVMNLPEPLVYYRKRAGSMQLDLFWDRHRNVMRLAENQRRGVAGQAPIGRDEFAAQLASAPAWRRFGRRKRALGMYYYRAGATDMVNGRRVRGSWELVAAAMLDGTRFRCGVRNAVRARLSRSSRARRAQAPDARSSPRPQT